MALIDMAITLTYALIGVTGAASFIIFVAGFGIYLVRLGTERRIEAIRIMEQGVRLIIGTFVLIGLLRILE